MALAPKPWSRPLLTRVPDPALVVLFVFAPEVLELRPPDRAKFGIPDGYDLDSIDLRQHLRSDDVRWFDAFFSPDMASVAQVPLPPPDRLNAVYSIRHMAEEPRDLGYLQAAWAVAAWLCELGATLVHNANAIAWKSADNLADLDPHRELDLGFEIACVFESDPTPGFGHLVHTRGLLNFGHPDFVLFGAHPRDARALGLILNMLAEEAALGRRFFPGERIGPLELPPAQIEDYEPEGPHPDVHLNNAGLCIDVSGWDLSEV